MEVLQCQYHSGMIGDIVIKPKVSTLSELTDTSITNPAGGQVLTWNSGASAWVNQAGGSGSGSSTLAGLNDTNISSLNNNEILKWTGSAWENSALTATAPTRETISYTVTIAAGTDVHLDLLASTYGSSHTNLDSYMVYEIQTSHQAWFRLYNSTTTRTNDATRDIDTDPTPGNGLLVETIHTDGSIVPITPGAYAWHDDVSGAKRSNLIIALKNTGTSSQAITLQVKILPLEYS